MVARVLVDTNIVIDYLDGVPEAIAELGRYSNLAISLVTYMEVRIGLYKVSDPVRIFHTQQFLRGFRLYLISPRTVAERAVEVRAAALAAGVRALKLPDAIIKATAEVSGRLLVSRNAKDFAHDGATVRIPYQLDSVTKAVFDIKP